MFIRFDQNKSARLLRKDNELFLFIYFLFQKVVVPFFILKMGDLIWRSSPKAKYWKRISVLHLLSRSTHIYYGEEKSEIFIKWMNQINISHDTDIWGEVGEFGWPTQVWRPFYFKRIPSNSLTPTNYSSSLNIKLVQTELFDLETSYIRAPQLWD